MILWFQCLNPIQESPQEIGEFRLNLECIGCWLEKISTGGAGRIHALLIHLRRLSFWVVSTEALLPP